MLDQVLLAKTVLVNKPIHPVALERLRGEVVDLLTPWTAPEDEVRALLPGVHAIILGAGLPVGAAELDLAPGLEVIARHGAGVDTVDLAAATARGIPVTYTPYGPTESTAEHALLLMLAAARRLPQLDRAVRSGDFALRDRPEAMGHELDGKALGLVGFGRIGRRLAEMCRAALHMAIHVYDPYLGPNEIVVWGAEYVSDLVELARRVDVLTVHVPLAPDTLSLVSRDVLRAMKPGAILINTSRGPIVDAAALIEAVESGHLGGVGLDVYDPQPPPPNHPLLASDRVVLTPHVASCTHEGRERMGLTAVADVVRVLRGQRPEYLANPEVWTK
ncbi:MAG TPA: NAD(P)-dependent oxidoreductase [Anaerolineae bacterium]|nr:NAD(P)-dependent oxidoreductase [Anaerolineae bacterium]